MFYLSSLTRDICVCPSEASGDLDAVFTRELRALEGTILGATGYLICILEFTQSSSGKVDNETGYVTFKVDYVAVTFKLEQGEYLVACPYLINEHGFYCRVGEAQVFVSRHMIKNWAHDQEHNLWTNERSGAAVKLNKPVTLRIVKSKINFDEMTSLAVIVE